MKLSLLCCLLCIFGLVNGSNSSGKYWKSYGLDSKYAYPEYREKSIATILKRKPNYGLAVSGGGLRSYMLSIGYYKGLLDIDVWRRIRYISSVSGGSWASVPFIFHNYAHIPNGKRSDNQFLGAYTRPFDLNIRNVNDIEATSGKAIPSVLDVRLNGLFDLVLEGYSASDVWYSTIEEVFLKPVGIKPKSIFFYSIQQALECIERNEFILAHNLITPCGSFKGREIFDPGLQEDVKSCEESEDMKPFLIINSDILGPYNEAPFNLFNFNALNYESTPLYSGVGQISQLSYNEQTYTFDTFYENIMNGAKPVKKVSETEMSFERNGSLFTLANATATSSWAPGSFLSSNSLINSYLNRYVELTVPSYALTGNDSGDIKNSTILLGDGGTMDNLGIFPLLKRKVDKIVLLMNTNKPLARSTEFNPFIQSPTRGTADNFFLSLFGFLNNFPKLGFDLRKNHVFNKRQFTWVMSALQKRKHEGNGIVVPFKLKTVRNTFHGIEPEREVEVLFIYLDRCGQWINELDPNVRDMVDMKVFPYIPTSELSYSPALTNLLSNLATWTIHENEEVIRNFLK